MHLRLSSPQSDGSDESASVDHTINTMQLIQPVGAAGGGHQQHTSYTSISSWKRTKRLFLWSIVLLQVGFVVCFWLMQLDPSEHLDESSAGATNVAFGDGEHKRINFIKHKVLAKEKRVRSKRPNNFQWPSRDLKFQQDFVLQHNNYNLSEAEKQMFGDTSVWCFREGTSNDTKLSRDEDSSQWPDNCHCLPEWHGQDCGQPEVIWRALMTAKLTFKLQNPTQNEAHRLVYMIEGPMLSMDLLELQIEAVKKVVDYFIIYYTRNPTSIKDVKTLKYRLKQMLPDRNYLLYYCKLPSLSSNCSAAEAYRIFRQHQLYTNAIKPTDLFIHTDDRVILGHRALNFLKYYSSSSIMPSIVFRLKFNVYGFYYQHPKRTKLNGLICSFQFVDNINSDPSYVNFILHRSFSLDPTASQRSILVIGDLNHFGGWFCKYCQEPEEIISELQLFQSSSGSNITKSVNIASSRSHILRSIENEIVFPTGKTINSGYVVQLMSQGLYLNDGKTQLLRVSRFSEQYFAPGYATQKSWKYSHLLINLYEHIDDYNEEEMF